VMPPLDAQAAATEEHATSVAEWSARIAQELGLDLHAVQRVALAGRLHDVGKLHVPRAILDKPGRLSEREWAIVRRHPEHGARLLADPAFDDIRPWVLFHHERPDGRGYPYGLGGADIPLGALIVAVADTWSAMTTDRPYRRAMSREVAAAELRAGAGSQWDPRCAGALLAVAGCGAATLRQRERVAALPRLRAAAHAPLAA